MAKGTQIIQFLRNTPATNYASFDAAVAAIEAAKGNKSVQDGSPILARYTDGDVVKSVLGIVYVSGNTRNVTIINDQANIADMIKAYVGTGVTTANTATMQLTALSGSDADTSATTSVAGAKKYADEKVRVEKARAESAETALDDKISALADVVDGDRVVAGDAISAVSAANGTTVSVKYDNDTIVLKDGKLSVASSALTPYTGENAIEVATGETAHTVKLKIDTADTMLTQSTAGVKSNFSVDYVSADKKIYFYGKDSSDKSKAIGSVDTTDFVKDGMIDSVSYDEDTKVITITWNTDAGKEAVNLPLSGLVDTYNAASGVAKTDVDGVKTFTGVVDADSEAFLTVGANGFKVSGVNDAITGAVKTETDRALAAESGLNNAIIAETKAREDAISALTDELDAEIENRENADTDIKEQFGAIMGQEGTGYTADTSAKYISGATSLQDADKKLDDAIKALVEAQVTDVKVNDESVVDEDGVASITLNGGIKLSAYTKGSSSAAVASTDSISDAFSKVENQIDGEKARAEAKELELNNAITAETKAREDADSALNASITAETKAREDADSALNASITAETKAREDADKVISGAVTAETEAREAADQVISGAVTAETEAREAADQVISGAVTALSADLATVSGKADSALTTIEAATTGYTGGTDEFATSVTQVNGKITAVGFAKPAASGVTFQASTGSHVTATTVQGAIDELQGEIDDLEEAQAVAMYDKDDNVVTKVLVDGQDYTLKQGKKTVAVFNIAADMVVDSGSVITADGTEKKGTAADAESAGLVSGKTYVVLRLANADTKENLLYIEASKLVDVYTGSTGTTVDVTVDGYTIKAEVKDGSIATAKLADSAVTTAKLADAAVTSAKVATDAIATDNIQNGAVTEDKLAQAVKDEMAKALTSATDSDTIEIDATELANKVVKASIIDSAVTTAKLADEAVTSAKVASDAIATANIQDGAVTEDKLAQAVKEEMAKHLTGITVNGVTGTVTSQVASVDLGASNVKLSGYTAEGVTAGQALATGDTVNQALAKLYATALANKVSDGVATVVSDATDGGVQVDVQVDEESILVGDDNKLAVGTVDCGEY